jgi:hypothetical protein
MNFLEPLGLLGLTALVPIIALYFLKLKREHRVVPSTLLWKKVIDDMQVNSPFQKLKYSLLLLLQLLLVALLGFALARPYLSLSGYAGSKSILLIDTSASMATRDAGRSGDLTRLEAAVREAEIKINDMRQNDEIMLVTFDRDVRQLSKFSNDRGLLKQILAGIKTRDVITRANEAFETAMALCDGQTDVKVLVLSDGCFGKVKLLKDQDKVVKGNTEDVGSAAQQVSEVDRLQRRLSNFKFVSYGQDASDNIGITQIDARSRPIKTTDDNGKRVDMLETQIFVMVENFSSQSRDVVLSLSTGERRFQPKVITLKGRPSRGESLGDSAQGTTSEASRSVEVFKLPLGTTGVVTAHIDSPRDKFSIDDTANCVIGNVEGTHLLLVSKGNYFLEKALGAMKGVNITTMLPDDFVKQWDQKAQQLVEPYDACVFEDVAPISWTEGGALFLGSMPPLPGFAKDAKPVEWPSVVDWDISHPVMRYVNFGNVNVAKSHAWTVPKTTRIIVEGSGGPLVVASESDRLRTIGISFDIFSSDWAYRPALPLFLRNAVPWLAEASPRRHPTGQQTGEPIVIPPGLGADTATLHKPDGSSEKLEISRDHTTFSKGTDKAGLYYLKDLPVERTYAVNLASRDESENGAQAVLRVNDFTMQSNPSAIEAKREIWRDLALAAAGLLLLEWWVFHRRVGM